MTDRPTTAAPPLSIDLRTQAAKDLLDYAAAWPEAWPGLLDRILAIEAEAAAPEITVEALAEALHRMDFVNGHDYKDPSHRAAHAADAAAILAALREQP